MVIREGYKRTEAGVIPEDWECMKIGKIADICMCKRVFSEQTGENFEIPFYKIGTFGKKADTYIPRKLFEEYRRKYSYPKEGDVLLSASGTLGRTVVFDGKDAYFQDSNIVWLDINKAILCNQFLNHFYKVIKWASWEGTTISRLYNGIIRDTYVIVPPMDEQKEIADALSDVDHLISSLKKLIAKKKAVRQGAMQELLTGKKRLPGFSGEWKEINLMKESKIKARIGWQGLKKSEYLNNGYAILVTGTDFNEGRICWESCHYIDKGRYDLDKNIQLQENDILITKDGSLGKAALVKGLKHPAALNSGIFVIRPLLNAYDPVFMYHVLTSFLFRNFLDKLSAGSTIVHLYQKDLNKFEFLMPAMIKEQQAIARVLSAMDAEILKLEQKLEKYRQIRQGMMQELLTGKIRLV